MLCVEMMLMYYLNKISFDIQHQAKSFKYFLRNIVLDQLSYEVLELIARQNDVFIFSGVIRDFLTGNYEFSRDFDCVVNGTFLKDSSIIDYLRNSTYKLNSFGGLKIKRQNLVIDIWKLQDTWGIKEMKADINPNSLIKSAFFNFSAIVYDFKREKFIYDENFCMFLLTKTMDVVYEENPNIPLCLVNIYHYNHKYMFSISLKMAGWIKRHYSDKMDLESIQILHFGRIIYPQIEVESFINEIIEKYDVQNRLE